MATAARPAPGAAPASSREAANSADWRILWRLLRYIAPYRRLVALQLGLLALASVFQYAPWLLVRRAIDVVIPAGDRRGLLVLALLFLGLVGLEFFTRYASLLAMMITGQGVVRDLRKEVFARIQRLDQATFDRTPVGRLMVRATSDVESLEEMFASGVISILGDVFKLGLLLVLMFALDVRLTLAALALTPLFLLLSLWFRIRIRDAYRLVRKTLAQLNAYLSEVLLGFRVVRLFGQEAQERKRFGRRSDELLGAHLRSVGWDSTYSSLVEMLASFAVAAVIWHGGGEVVRGAVTLGTLFVFIEFAQQFFQPLQDLSQKYATLQSAMASSERVFALLDQEDRVRSPVLVPGAAPPELPAPRGAVSFRQVCFAYPGGAPALEDLSFELAPGRTLALVGATGSGKTTVTRLLSRLHDLPRDRPEDADPATTPGGAILLDGLDLRDYPLEVLRRRVGVVLQDPYLFSGSLRDNLFLREESGDDEAWAALETVGVADAMRRLGGLDSVLAERGGNLSAGEAQLVTLARALLYDPCVLLLDEATAAVDSLTERKLQAALERLMAERTSIVVAHRLSTVQRADEILVLHRGRLRERGTHRQLLAAKGIYERLYRLQLPQR